MMEKLGVSSEELITELQQKYNQLKERQQAGLSKEASAQVTNEINAVKAKLDEILGH
jgi:DNA-binding MarR family transcriptional regulator